MCAYGVHLIYLYHMYVDVHKKNTNNHYHLLPIPFFWWIRFSLAFTSFIYTISVARGCISIRSFICSLHRLFSSQYGINSIYSFDLVPLHRMDENDFICVICCLWTMLQIFFRNDASKCVCECVRLHSISFSLGLATNKSLSINWPTTMYCP